MAVTSKEIAICAIVGQIGYVAENRWSESYALFRAMLLAAQSRGADATGIVCRTEPYERRTSGRVLMSKAPVPARTFVARDALFGSLRHRRTAVYIGHCRLATHGDPYAAKGANNHPFISRDRRLYLVHNGVLFQHREAADAYSLRLETDCDSELLLRIVEAAPDPVGGLFDCLRLRGSMAVAIYDAQQDVVYLARNHSRPLWLLQFRGERRWLFASTDEILLTAVESALGTDALRRVDYLAPIPQGIPLVLSMDGALLAAAASTSPGEKT